MKSSNWKEKDRALATRAQMGGIAWNSARQGTFAAGRNAAKRHRRARAKGLK